MGLFLVTGLLRSDVRRRLQPAPSKSTRSRGRRELEVERSRNEQMPTNWIPIDVFDRAALWFGSSANNEVARTREGIGLWRIIHEGVAFGLMKSSLVSRAKWRLVMGFH